MQQTPPPRPRSSRARARPRRRSRRRWWRRGSDGSRATSRRSRWWRPPAVVHLQHARLDLHHRRDRARVPGRLPAVERVAGTNEIEVELRSEHQPVGGGEARRRSGKCRETAAEGGALLAVERMSGLVGAGEVAHHEREAEAAHELGIGGEPCDLRSRHAEPVQARIEVQSGRCRGAAAGRRLDPLAHLLQARQHGPRAEPDELARGVRGEPVQDVERRLRDKRARRGGFRHRGHEEGAAPRRRQRRDHLVRAEPVGVRLDDGPALGRRDQGGQGAPVRAEPIEIDRDHAARLAGTSSSPP